MKLVLIGQKYHRVIDYEYTRTDCGRYGDQTRIVEVKLEHEANFRRDFYCRKCFPTR